MPKLEARHSKHEPLGEIYVSNSNKGVSFPSFDGFREMSGVGTGHTKTNLSAPRFICPRETKGKEQERERREKGQRMEKGYLPQKYKGLPLDREQTEMAHSQITIYKPLVRINWTVLIGHINYSIQ